MWINEISEQKCREILSRASAGRLGCALDDQPYVVPIFLAYEPDYIYVFSTMGKKIEWMRANPKVCVEVDEVASPSAWTSVIVNGRYQELSEPGFEDERAHARKLLEKRHHWWLNALAERRLKIRDSQIEPIFFRIHLESLSGLATQSEGSAENEEGSEGNEEAA